MYSDDFPLLTINFQHIEEYEDRKVNYNHKKPTLFSSTVSRGCTNTLLPQL